MKRSIFGRFVLVILCVLTVAGARMRQHDVGAPPYGEAENEVPNFDPFAYLKNWTRPNGPAKVALQVGHWKNDEFPDELEKLRANTGASGGGKWEWEVNLQIAEQTAQILKDKGISVEILPATIPEGYWADVFLAIHADGSTDKTKSGYKFAGPWRDFTGKSEELVSLLETNYEKVTNLSKDPNITQNMRGYYAFAWWKYDHSIHPMTTAAIAETGFLTNKNDQKLLINNSRISAQAIADGIVEYLTSQNLL